LNFPTWLEKKGFIQYSDWINLN